MGLGLEVSNILKTLGGTMGRIDENLPASVKGKTNEIQVALGSKEEININGKGISLTAAQAEKLLGISNSTVNHYQC